MDAKSERVFCLTEVLGGGDDKHLKKLHFTNSEQIIGRSQEVDLGIPIPSVSRKHAAVWVKDGVPYIKDLRSSHGTFVNSVRIEQPVALRQGDLVSFGNEIVFLLNAVEEAEIAALEKAALSDQKLVESDLVELALYDEPSKDGRKAYLNVFREIAEAASIANNEAEFFVFVVDKLSYAMNAGRVMVLLGSQPEKLTIGARKLNSPDETRKWNAPSKAILRRALLSDKVTISFDAQSDGRFRGRVSIALTNVRSAICVGLKTGVHTIGVLYADNQVKTGQFSMADGYFFQVIGQLVALTVIRIRSDHENLRLGNKTENQRKKHTESITDLAKCIDSHIERLETIAEQIENEKGADAFSKALREESQKLRSDSDHCLCWAKQEITRPGTGDDIVVKNICSDNNNSEFLDLDEAKEVSIRELNAVEYFEDNPTLGAFDIGTEADLDTIPPPDPDPALED